MGAEALLQVLGDELALAFAIERPVGDIADHLNRRSATKKTFERSVYLRLIFLQFSRDDVQGFEHVGNMDGLAWPASTGIYVTAFPVARIEEHVGDAPHVEELAVATHVIRGAIFGVAVEAVVVAGVRRDDGVFRLCCSCVD